MKFHKGYFTVSLRQGFKRKNSVKNTAERQFFASALSNSLFRLNFKQNPSAFGAGTYYYHTTRGIFE